MSKIQLELAQTSTPKAAEAVLGLQPLSATSKFNAFWVSLLIVCQLVSLGFATDWALVTLFHLPMVITVILAAITSAGVLYGTWFTIRAAILSEREFAGQIQGQSLAYSEA